MRLVTWNIQWGRGMDGLVDLARIVREARAFADFDVLCLQEVSDGCDDLDGCDGADQFAALAALLPAYTPIAGVTYDGPGPRGRRRFGNMILSRLPVEHVLRHTLPWPADPARSMPRGALEVTVRAAFGPVRVVTTHLEYWSAPLRAAQVEGLRRIHAEAASRALHPGEEGPGTYRLGERSSSAILTGDFNMPPDDASVVRLTAPFPQGVPGFRDAWTIARPGVPQPPTFCLEDRTWGEPKACDLVFVTEDLAPLVLSAAVNAATRASDHQPVLVELGSSRS